MHPDKHRNYLQSQSIEIVLDLENICNRYKSLLTQITDLPIVVCVEITHTTMEFESRTADDVIKLPTFAQWIKSSSAAEQKPVRVVRTVWLPNRFANLTFETEVFRLRIANTNPIFKPLLSSIEAAAEQGVCLAVSVLDAKEGEYKIHSLPNESSTWEALGDNGYKLTVDNKKSSKRAPK